VCSWDCQVAFIPEEEAPTPEWAASRGAARVLVECTSFERVAEQVNDTQSIGTAITTAWNAKRVKFSGGDPGIISTDISGLFVSREYGTLLSADLWERIDATTPAGHPRHLGVYRLAQDWELLQQESQNRQMLGIITSALYSREAVQRNIRGLMSYQGQQVAVDLVNDVFRIPKRGFLVWRGGLDNDDLTNILVALHQPATPRTIPQGRATPLGLFLV
jgi:hypothetical protein